MELDLLVRWLSETVFTLDYKNQWFYDIPYEAREYLELVGEQLVTLFG